MKIRIKKYILLLIFFNLFYGLAYSQTPSGHAEVWKNVETYWGLWAQRNLDKFLEYHHKAYSGWNYEDPMHKSKKSTREWMDHAFKTREVITFDISAIDIKIHNNTAVVHYYYSILEKDIGGNEKKSNGRKTDILIKQDDKWVIIADHGGNTYKN